MLSCTVAENVAQAMDGIDEEKVRYCLDQAGLTEKITSLPAGIKTDVYKRQAGHRCPKR